MADKRLLRELKGLKNESNPQILHLAPLKEDLRHWTATIAKPLHPDLPFYYNGKWNLEIDIPDSYPMQPPKIKFSKKTPIAHPNIDIQTGEICLDILKSGWSPAWNLHHLVMAILMLVDDPEPDSPLNIDMANLWRCDKVAYESVVQYFMWKNRALYDGESHIGGAN